MRDIVWIISFMAKSKKINESIERRYAESLYILLKEGVEFLPLTNASKAELRSELDSLIKL